MIEIMMRNHNTAEWKLVAIQEEMVEDTPVLEAWLLGPVRKYLEELAAEPVEAQ